MSTPSPLDLAKRRAVQAVIDTDAPAKKIVWVKACRLQPGMTVRPLVNGEPRGSVRTVATRTRIRHNNGDDTIAVTYSSGHETVILPPAYRFVEV